MNSKKLNTQNRKKLGFLNKIYRLNQSNDQQNQNVDQAGLEEDFTVHFHLLGTSLQDQPYKQGVQQNAKPKHRPIINGVQNAY